MTRIALRSIRGLHRKTVKPAVFLALLPALMAPAAYAQASSHSVQQDAKPLDWDQAFAVTSPTGNVHFRSFYVDGKGAQHSLEVWHQGFLHLRRVTDGRLDLHADMDVLPKGNLPGRYTWQVIDVDKKIDHRISSDNMTKAGMFYSYWSQAHVLTRPSGNFTVTRLSGLPKVELGKLGCDWYTISPSGLPASRACWSGAIGAPLEIQSQHADGTWYTSFKITAADRGVLPASLFAVDTKPLRIFDADQYGDDD